jgi:periplasmic divalent cation tolerance protein
MGRMAMTDVVVLYTTWPDGETAEAAGRAAVETGLAACGNVLAPMRSTYRWEGRIETATETPALFKTRADLAARLRDWITERHPYDTPAILAFTAGPASLPAYLAWVAAEARGDDAAEPPQPSGSAAAMTGAKPS